MNKVNVLDCTLRDGGYINEWQFGAKNIKKIINSLFDANIDIIECGFLTQKKEISQELSLFDNVESIVEYLPTNKKEKMTVCMINYGEYDVESLPEYDGRSIDGIRVAFHKKDLNEALKMCETIIKKGYKLFLQPMVSISYSDKEFLKLISKANVLQPYAFYIVDSFGVMKTKDLLRLFYLVDHNLLDNICVGYHSHNNIQMAYPNAQALVDLKTKRKLIIDSSVFGMGRGAGNLNTELFIEYLNELNGNKYKIKPLLKIIDQVLNSIYASDFWGYSLPHYISAINNCHPNYASHLDNKNTLTVENINEILNGLDETKRNNFDTNYIEKLYIQYQDRATTDDRAKKQLATDLNGKIVVVIASGSSINNDQEKIIKEISHKDRVAISINFNPEKFKCDYIFVSNLRRYENLKTLENIRLIKTSNLENESANGVIVNYSDLTNDIVGVEDNAGMMLIKFLIDIGVKKIKLAGFDGYSYCAHANFAEKELVFIKSEEVIDAVNEGMEKMINAFAENIDIEFITKPRYIKLGESK